MSDTTARAMRGCRGIVSILGFVLAFALGAADAAPPAGTVTGVVKNALGGTLGAAQVRLEAEDGRVVARTTADDQGAFTFTNVAPGTYAVIGEKEGFERSTAIVTVPATEGATAELTLPSRQALDVKVAAKRLEEARIANIQPRIGASTYEITKEAVETQPGGSNNSLTQVILQAPGVSQDTTSQGGFHVRNEHANVQFRINGVQLPEGVRVFELSEGLSPRLASSIDLLTGTLPAEFGLRTAGIIDVQTKSGAFQQGGYLSMYGGSFSWLQPSVEYSGSLGRFNYFLSGTYLQNSIGISPATPNGPIHDDTEQGRGFGYFEYLLDSTSKVSAILGSFVGHYQIPNRRGAMPNLGFTVNGISTFDSTRMNETELEQNYYAVLAYLKAERELSYQIAAFTRYTTLNFHPDPLADLLFNGVAQRYDRSSVAEGLQVDASYVLTPSHTLRAGLLFNAERTSVQTKSRVLPTDMTGAQTSVVPFEIFDSTGKMGYTYSVYAQDAWNIVRNVTINGGVRFDYLDAFTTDWEFSPRLNVVWLATPSTTVHVGYARYFTPPPLVFTSTATLNKFVGTSNESPVKDNTTIRPERAHYFDAGVVQQIGRGLKVGIDAYYKMATDQLDDGQFGAPILITPFNYKRGQNLGVELTVSGTVGNFTGYGNLAAAHQEATRITTAQALFVPDDVEFIRDHWIHTDHDQLITASAGLAYLLWNKTRFSVDMLAASGLRRTVHRPNDASVPPYQQVNLGISHRFTLPAIGKMEARFDIINLLDNNYVIRDGTGVGVFARQFGPPRGFFGGLKKEF